jgi:hypothetical protein
VNPNISNAIKYYLYLIIKMKGERTPPRQN